MEEAGAMERKQSRHSIWRAFAVRFAPGALIITGMCILILWYLGEEETNRTEGNYLDQIALASEAFEIANSRLTSVARLAMLQSVQSYAANRTDEKAAVVLEDLKSWSVYYPVIHELRFVAADGTETVAIRPVWENETIVIGWNVESSDLANVSTDSYFEPSIHLSRGEVFASEIVLGRTVNSEQRLEDSQVPIMYASAVVLEANTSALPINWGDPEDQPAAAGFVVLSIHAQVLLDDLTSVFDTEGVTDLEAGVGHLQTHIVNAAGYWLYSNQVGENATFAWQRNGQEGVSFVAANPSLWASVLSEGADESSDGGAYQFHHGNDLVNVYHGNVCDIRKNDLTTTIECERANNAETYVVMIVPDGYILGKGLKTWQLTTIFVLIGCLLLWAVASAALVSSARANRQAVDRRITMEHFRTRNKEMFLQTMSHEIRTPLNAVIGAISMLAGPDIPASKQPLVEICEEAAKLMMGVLNDVLDVGKIESGALVLNPVLFNIRAAVGSCVEIHAAAATRKNLDIYLKVDADVPEAVVADDLRIKQLLSNLLSNAVKFCGKGSITVTVQRAAAPPTLSLPPSQPQSQRGRLVPARLALKNERRQSPHLQLETSLRSRQSTAAVAPAPLSVEATRHSASTAAAADSAQAGRVRAASSGSGAGWRSESAPESASSAAAAAVAVSPAELCPPVGGGSLSQPAAAAAAAAAAVAAAVPRIAVARKSSSSRSVSTREASDDDGAANNSSGQLVPLVISVRDTGKGIANGENGEVLERIFNAFEQEEVGTTRRYGGSGLGLFIVRKLAEAMGGTIKVTSKLGEGSTFSAYLNVALPNSGPSSPHYASNGSAAAAQAAIDGAGGAAMTAQPAAAAATAAALYVGAMEMCQAHAEALSEAVSRLESPALLLPQPQGVSKDACAPESVLRACCSAMAAAPVDDATGDLSGERLSEDVENGGACADAREKLAVLVADTICMGAGTPEALLELRTRISESAEADESAPVALLVLLDGKWAHLASSALLEGYFTETMPVTPWKLSAALARVAMSLQTLRATEEDQESVSGFQESVSGFQESVSGFAYPQFPRERKSSTRSWSAPNNRSRNASVQSTTSATMHGNGTIMCGSPPAIAAEGSAAGGALTSLRCLVVDDVRANRQILEHMLTQQGHQVVCAASGEEAVEADRRQSPPFHLILMDLQMAGNMDGADACARIVERHGPSRGSPAEACSGDTSPRAGTVTVAHGGRSSISSGTFRARWGGDGSGQAVSERVEPAEQQGRPPVVVILTASALELDRVRCIAAGASGFLTKPLPWQRLKDYIANDFPPLWGTGAPLPDPA